MHDLGLNFEISGTQRSEFYGEDIALHFVLEHDASQHRIALPWDSLAFQTSGKIYDQVRAEVALAGFGVFGESTGTGIESQPMKHIQEGLQARPGTVSDAYFNSYGAEIVGRKPETAQVGDWNTASLPENLAISDGQ